MKQRDTRIPVDPDYYPELRALKLRYEASTLASVTMTWTEFLKFLVARAFPQGVAEDQGLSE